MDRLGLGYDALRAIRPDLIYVSSSGGRTGPGRSGWPTAAPAGSERLDVPLQRSNPKMEARASRLAGRPLTDLEALIVQAALQYVRAPVGARCGHVHGREHHPDDGRCVPRHRHRGTAGAGTRAARLRARGIYPCRADDTWIAISVSDNSEWRRCARRSTRRPGAARASCAPPRVAGAAARGWTHGWRSDRAHSAGELFHQLQAPACRLPRATPDGYHRRSSDAGPRPVRRARLEGGGPAYGCPPVREEEQSGRARFGPPRPSESTTTMCSGHPGALRAGVRVVPARRRPRLTPEALSPNWRSTERRVTAGNVAGTSATETL